jgi:hypothetical protein
MYEYIETYLREQIMSNIILYNIIMRLTYRSHEETLNAYRIMAGRALGK